MDASPPRSDSFSRGWLRRSCAARPGFERLDADDGLGHSFNSSASFIDMDPAELFSMRWTSAVAAAEEEDENGDFDFGLEPCAGARSPLLVGTGRVFSDDDLVLRCSASTAALNGGGGCSYADVSPGSSPVFHSAQSTPASVIRSSLPAGVKARAAPEPLLATRRILLRYLRFLAPLCRKARTLPLRVFAPRSRTTLAATMTATATSSARRSSTSSFASAAEYWCHGNADTAVRDAILYCKKSIGQDM